MRAQFANKDQRLALCGYGVPNLAFASECARERTTVVFEDDIPNAVKDDANRWRRTMGLYRLPVPSEFADEQLDIELRVTLSYFAEPKRSRSTVEYGMDLRWDMQGPTESEDDFLKRINADARDPDESAPDGGGSFQWEIGRQRRSRGTVQSDRWVGPAAQIAGSRLIAVYPIRGWWDRRSDLRGETMDFSLVATVRALGDLDVFTPISAEIVPISVST